MDITLFRGAAEDDARDIDWTGSAEAFQAIMSAMARPGQVVEAGVDAPGALSPATGAALLALADGSTSVWLEPAIATRAVRGWLGYRSGARLTDHPSDALIGVGSWPALAPLERWAAGTAIYPDRSATLIVEVDSLKDGPPLSLSGPGIAEAATLQLGAHGPALLPAIQANAARYPHGVDWIFTCDVHLVAVPRSTRVAG